MAYHMIDVICTVSHDANSERMNMFLNNYQGYYSKQTRDQIYGHSL